MIISPLATGNGAYILHKTLESQLSDYKVIPYHPYRTLFPPLLYSLGRRNAAQLIHTSPDYGVFHLRNNIPMVVTFHNYVLDRDFHIHSSALQNIHYRTDLRLFTRLSVNYAAMATAVSQFTAQIARQDLNLKQDIRVIYNGINTKEFFPLRYNNSGTKVIKVLFSGNLTARKGAHWLVPIANKLSSGIEILYTRGLQSKNSLPDHPKLRCLDSVSHHEMPAIYQYADILLFPTVREGFSLAGLEAMACGLPVVATNCSSLPEMVDDGKGGFLCKLGDVDAFAEKINLLAENALLRREMGEYNRAKVERFFTLERMAKDYADVFEEVLS
jgi:glycosyltransferase involved in cell wall biosynthesis